MRAARASRPCDVGATVPILSRFSSSCRYPRTSPGRCVLIIAALSGVILITLLVNVVSFRVPLRPRQKRAADALRAHFLRIQRHHDAAVLVGRAVQYFWWLRRSRGMLSGPLMAPVKPLAPSSLSAARGRAAQATSLGIRYDGHSSTGAAHSNTPSGRRWGRGCCSEHCCSTTVGYWMAIFGCYGRRGPMGVYTYQTIRRGHRAKDLADALDGFVAALQRWRATLKAVKLHNEAIEADKQDNFIVFGDEEPAGAGGRNAGRQAASSAGANAALMQQLAALQSQVAALTRALQASGAVAAPPTAADATPVPSADASASAGASLPTVPASTSPAPASGPHQRIGRGLTLGQLMPLHVGGTTSSASIVFAGAVASGGSAVGVHSRAASAAPLAAAPSATAARPAWGPAGGSGLSAQ